MTSCILVPLDGSTCAHHALSYALRIAKAEAARVEFRTFVDPRAVVGRSLATPLKEEHVAAAMVEARRIVADAVAEASRAGVHASGRAELGEPALEIVKHATELGADAIVLGTHGSSGFRRLSMGSVAERVLRSASCPVVVVRENAAAEQGSSLTPTIDDDAPVWAMRLVEVAPDDFERLYGKIATFMEGPGTALPGVLESQLLGSADGTRILILVRFRSRADWAHAQWDPRFGRLLEEIAVNSETLEFDLYSGERFTPNAPRAIRPTEFPYPAGSRRYDAVVVVASIGGIPALATLLSTLPKNFPLPILIVQHRSTARPSMLSSILGRSTQLRVKVAENGETPVPGCVYLAPPDHHLLITRSHQLSLMDGRRVRHLLSAGDPLFTSAAKAYGSRVIAVVLTGTDSDGARGVTDVKEAGGAVLVQDEATSEAFAMPAAAIATGCVDMELPITKIGPELARLAALPQLAIKGAS